MIASANQSRRRRLLPFALFSLLTLGACSGVNTRTVDGRPIRMTRAEFAEYVETTFRYHNRVVNELITASILGDEKIPIDSSLIRAEEHMAASCQPLNEMVTATIEGRELSFWAKMRLLNQVPLCEAATRSVEVMIPAAF